MKKSKYIFLFLLSALLLSQCGAGPDSEDIEIPAGVLDEERYTQLLVDFSLAESAINLNIKNLSGAKFDSAYTFNPLKENNVSTGLYDSTIDFYSKHPQLYRKIYEEVLIRLSKIQTEREKLEADTTRNLKKVSGAEASVKTTT
jgi:hypothetical protein